MGGQKGESGCSVDLKLGRLEGSSSSSSSSSGTMRAHGSSSKRPRTPGGAGQQTATCAVDGCKADLSGCREYHRRHKVCELHSKTPVVMVGGLQQRFCQQCSRFHVLVEFDEGKRSCRKRLDGHNRRRRKPQPEPTSLGNLFPIYQGPRFSYPHMVPTTIPDPSWVSVLKNDGHLQPFQLMERQRHNITTSTFHIYKEGKQIPYVHNDNPMVLHNGNAVLNSDLQPLGSNVPSSKGSSQAEYPNGVTQVLNSDCALSLLSSPTQTPPARLGNVVSASHTPFGQPVSQNVQHLGDLGRYSRPQVSNSISTIGLSCMGTDEKLVNSVVDCDSSNVMDLRCQGTYHTEEDGVYGHGEALPFSWQ